MIYTLTLNPAFDYYLNTDSFVIGKTNRSNSERLTFGGKGINVSLMLKEFGVDSTVLGFIGGFTGKALKTHLESIGLRTDFMELEKGITRINVKIKSDAETELNSAGPDITTAEYEEFLLKLDALKNGDTLVLAGKIPSSLSVFAYAEISAILSDRDIRIVVDAEGEALLAALRYKPFLIKPNLAELEGAVGKKLESTDDISLAAQTLQNLGAKNVLVSLGNDGALLLDEASNFHIQPAPDIEAINTVGAGDSMLAAFLANLDKGYESALKSAVIVGSATASCEGLATAEDIKSLQEKTDWL